MTRFAVLSAILLFGCTSEEPAPRAIPQPTEMQRRLRAIFELGDGDPIGDARRAARRRDFRLFWNDDHWEGGTIVGLHCRIPDAAAYRPARLLTRRTGTLAPSCASLGEEHLCKAEGRLGRYMPTYNRALLSSPEFPYPDLCTTDEVVVDGHPALHDSERFSSERSAIIDATRNIGEAARRGSRASLERLLQGMTAAELNRADDLGLTPLAWAVAEHRGENAALLLARGSDPIAGHAAANRNWDLIPLAMALRSGQNALADRMLTGEVKERLRPWPEAVLEAAQRGGNERLARLILRERESAARARVLAESERARAAERERRQSDELGRSVEKILLSR